MNSWEQMRDFFTVGTTPNTLGRLKKLNDCARLFIRIRTHLKDETIATESLNNDNEVRDALLNDAAINELKKDGVIN